MDVMAKFPMRIRTKGQGSMVMVEEEDGERELWRVMMKSEEV